LIGEIIYDKLSLTKWQFEREVFRMKINRIILAIGVSTLFLLVSLNRQGFSSIGEAAVHFFVFFSVFLAIYLMGDRAKKKNQS